MLIGVMSDIHDNAQALLQAVEIFNKEKIKKVVHCGDWVSPNMPNFCKGLKADIISVFGNSEGDRFSFLELWREKIKFYNALAELEFKGRKIAVYHGHDAGLLDGLLAGGKYDAVFTGHTHTAVNKLVGKTLYLNPGSVANIRWDKIIDDPSVAIYDTGSNSARIIPLD